MPFTTREKVVFLEGHCSIEEAEPLHEVLRGVEDSVFDLSEAGHLHTSIVQIIMASRGQVRGVAPDLVLAACFGDRQSD